MDPDKKQACEELSRENAYLKRQNKLVSENLKNYVVQLSVLNNIMLTVNQELGLENAFNNVFQNLNWVLPSCAVAFFAYESQERKLKLIGYNDLAAPIAKNFHMKAGDSFIPSTPAMLKTLSNRKITYIPELKRDTSDFFKKALEKTGFQSACLVPIFAGSELMGTLHVGKKIANGFSKPEIDFLENLTQHLAMVLRNVQLISDLAKALKSLKATQNQIIQLERLKALGEMASGIAHDINNTLLPISGTAEMLLMDAEKSGFSDSQVEDLKQILKSAKSIAGIVSRMREFYRKREPDEKMKKHSLEEIAKEAILLTKTRWKNDMEKEGKNVKIIQEFEKIPSIICNEIEIQEVFQNLIMNAVDSLVNGGKVTIRIRPEGNSGESAAFEVEDTGCGMSEEVIKRAFEPFFTTKGVKGTGLGLSIVWGIVQRHSGKIKIDSELGRGTKVLIVLPVLQNNRSKKTEEEHAGENPVKVHSLKILLVDDEEDVRNVIHRLLTLLSHDTVPVSSGREALEKFMGNKFDLVITDLGMPDLSGRDLARQIKALARGCPVILLSGWGEQLFLENEKEHGIDTVIPKPVSLETLQIEIAKLLEKT